MSGLDLRALPKAELHLHFEAAMSRENASRLARRSGLPEPGVGPFTDLTEFVTAYELARDIIGSLDDLRMLAADLAVRQLAEGIVWTEVHFIPATYAGRLGPADALVEAVLDGFRDGGGEHHVGLVIGINRGRPLSEAQEMLELASRWAGRGVVALGLAGDEAHYPARLFSDLFEEAAARGLTRVPHGGEGAGADHLRETLTRLSPHRVCHGVRATEDPQTVKLLRDRNICLDMAPVSNVLLGVVSDLASHPLPQLMSAGVPVTLNTDIPLFTGTSLSKEYASCAQAWGLRDQEVCRIARTSIERSSCVEPHRSAALDEVDRLLAGADRTPASSPDSRGLA